MRFIKFDFYTWLLSFSATDPLDISESRSKLFLLGCTVLLVGLLQAHEAREENIYDGSFCNSTQPDSVRQPSFCEAYILANIKVIILKQKPTDSNFF